MRAYWGPVGVLLGVIVGLQHADAGSTTTITLDGSLGAGGQVTSSGSNIFKILPTMGQAYGPNLFQSFGTFNLGTGDTASFLGNAATRNIIARVTGGSPSSIDGTMQSASNLFFLNPAGVMFGAHARMDVTGAFVVSTADYVSLQSGGIFYAKLGAGDSLTSAPVSAFGFLNASPGAVTFAGTQQTFDANRDFDVIAGDISFDLDLTTKNPTTLIATGGNLSFFSAASAGVVAFATSSPGTAFYLATNPTYGNITLANGTILELNEMPAARVASTKSLTIRGGKLVASSSSVIQDFNQSAYEGGQVKVNAAEIDLLSGSRIAAYSESAGASNLIRVTAGSLTVDGTNQGTSDTGIISEADGSGNAGSVNVYVPNGAVNLLEHGHISSETNAGGNGGDVLVDAETLNIDEEVISKSSNTGIFANANTDAMGTAPATGNAGNVTVDVTGGLTMENAGRIGARTFGPGRAGNVNVTATSVSMTSGSLITAGSLAFNALAGGAAGTVTVKAPTGLVSISGGSAIETSTTTNGNAGKVTVTAGSLNIDGSGQVKNVGGQLVGESTTGILSTSGTKNQIGATTATAGSVDVTVSGEASIENMGAVSSQTFGIGDAGGVTVNVADALSLTTHGQISAETSSVGAAGMVTVDAGSLDIVGTVRGATDSGIFANANRGATGKAGDVVVDVAGELTMDVRGRVASRTFGPGEGGNISLEAGSITMLDTSLISAGSESINRNAGPGGSITVTAHGDVTLDSGSQIGAESIVSRAGSVTLNVGDTLKVAHRSSITASAGTSGGNITLNVGKLVYLLQGNLIASAKTKGGDITIDPEFVVLDESTISANAAAGQGGNIIITTDNYLNNQSSLTATGTSNGTIDISSPPLNLSGSLYTLSAALVSEQNQLQEKCERSLNHEFSSLIVVGRGGTETAPEELQSDFGSAGRPEALHAATAPER